MNHASRRGIRIATAALMASLASCFTSVGKWTYPSGRYATTTSQQTAKAFVLVEPLLDQRGTVNLSYMPWSYVPFFPLGWTHFERPEATVHDQDTTEYHAEPCMDLARAIAIELQRQAVVEQVKFAADHQRGVGETHQLRGTLRAFSVAEQRWTYGLSIYAPAAWALGLPMGRSKNAFCVDLELVQVNTNRVVWAACLFDADNHIEGWYYGPEWYRFSWMWERRLREKLGELAQAVGAAAAPLPPELIDDLQRSPPPQMPPELLERAAKERAAKEAAAQSR